MDMEVIFSTCAKLVTTRGIEASSHAMRKIYDFSGYVNNLYRWDAELFVAGRRQ